MRREGEDATATERMEGNRAEVIEVGEVVVQLVP